MSRLGLLATAFGSYASTLGGLYKEQVDKEQAAQEKLAAEERQREWERQKMAEERMFAIDMLQRKFDLDVKRMDMENAWDAKNAAIEYQRDLEKEVFKHKLKLKEQEQAAQVDRRDLLARLMIAQGSSIGTENNPKNMKPVVDALKNRLDAAIGMYEAARSEEEKRRWYNEVVDAFNQLSSITGGGTSINKLIDPNDIINSLANE